MTFRITGLSAAPFRHLFGQTREALGKLGVERHIADRPYAFPDRIELRDAELGESMLLLNYVHQPAHTPYHSSHAIFVLENARDAFDAADEIPPALTRRVLSLRAFDREHRIVEADLADGGQAAPMIHRLLNDPHVEYLHAHYAKHGCYAARIDRA